jgi:LacI family transcriptional regulator
VRTLDQGPEVGRWLVFDHVTGEKNIGKPVSLRHVADRAGVSPATASRVLSGSDHPVNAATRQKVLSAAEQLGFEPNRLARALATARSQTVGVILHDVSDPYFGDIVKGLEDALHRADYHLFVASSDRHAEKELSYVRAFQAHQVDAIVFAASGLTDPGYQAELQSAVNRFHARGGVVMVLSDHFLNEPGVRFDNHAGTAAMVEYLYRKGHRRIGYLSGPSDIEVSRVRLEGFRSALAALGLSADRDLIVDGKFTAEGGAEAVMKIMARAEVTAVLAANDLMAMGALRQLLSSGRSVPGEISLAGIDDIAISQLAPVPLTTMRIPTHDMGKRAGRMLLAVLKGDEPTVEWVDGRIVERDSVGTLPAEMIV